MSKLNTIKGLKDTERFFEKVNKETESGCWEWTACKYAAGYGRFGIKNKVKKAHRVSWRLHKGEIKDGQLVCHKCDNPSCVNPDHLFTGTQKDNLRDAWKKGRLYDISQESKSKENHHNAKLTQEDVNRMRRMYKTGDYFHRELAKEFGISQGYVHKILNFKFWK